MSKLIPRHVAAELAATAPEFPVVTITGPRQAGKTALARTHFPDYAYANLESPDVRALTSSDPNAFFPQFPASPTTQGDTKHRRFRSASLRRSGLRRWPGRAGPVVDDGRIAEKLQPAKPGMEGFWAATVFVADRQGELRLRQDRRHWGWEEDDRKLLHVIAELV